MRSYAASPSFDAALNQLIYGPVQQGADVTPGRVVIGWGRKDRLCVPSQAIRALQLFPRAQLHWFEDCVVIRAKTKSNGNEDRPFSSHRVEEEVFNGTQSRNRFLNQRSQEETSKWSADVMKRSDALDLEEGVFTKGHCTRNRRLVEAFRGAQSPSQRNTVSIGHVHAQLSHQSRRQGAEGRTKIQAGARERRAAKTTRKSPTKKGVRPDIR